MTRAQDIANIKYFLSNKVEIDGHSRDIRTMASWTAHCVDRTAWHRLPEKQMRFWQHITGKLKTIANCGYREANA